MADAAASNPVAEMRAGSSPAPGTKDAGARAPLRRHRLAVRTPCSQHGKAGSIPAGASTFTTRWVFAYDGREPEPIGDGSIEASAAVPA